MGKEFSASATWAFAFCKSHETTFFVLIAHGQDENKVKLEKKNLFGSSTSVVSVPNNAYTTYQYVGHSQQV